MSAKLEITTSFWDRIHLAETAMSKITTYLWASIYDVTRVEPVLNEIIRIYPSAYNTKYRPQVTMSSEARVLGLTYLLAYQAKSTKRFEHLYEPLQNFAQQFSDAAIIKSKQSPLTQAFSEVPIGIVESQAGLLEILSREIVEQPTPDTFSDTGRIKGALETIFPSEW